MLKVFVLVVAVAVLAVEAKRTRWHELSELYSFDRYVTEFQKTYKNAAERRVRQQVFQTNLNTILKHNREQHTWKMGVNQFVDRTAEEMQHLRGLKRAQLYRELQTVQYAEKRPVDLLTLPKSVDWRQKNVIGQVKDQGQCGSCWTFGSVETIESYWALQTEQLPVLSEQYILDCASNPHNCGGTGGCQGATATIAIGTIINSPGIPSEWTYPYQSYFGTPFQCKNNTSQQAIPAVRVQSHIHLPLNHQAGVLQHLATTGPLITNVDASAWSFYESGVFSGCSINATIDHVVQLVGYGHDATSGLDYYLIRNSWAPSWGEDGYIRILRSPTPICGVDKNPGEGNGCTGGPGQVPVCGQCGVLFSNSYPVIVA